MAVGIAGDLALFVFARSMMRLASGSVWLRRCRAAVTACALWICAGMAVGATLTNTATISFNGPSGPTALVSNTTTLSSLPPPTPAQVIFYQFAPGTIGSSFIDFGAGLVEVRPTDVYHINASVYLTLTDANRNLDPLVREVISVTLSTDTAVADTETLLMQETAPNSGVFAAVISSVDPTVAVTPGNGQLSVATNTRISVNYQDPFYPTDTSTRVALVDPLGTVFDAVTGAPINGVTVTLINNATGMPATVFGDDGVSSFPSTVTTGASVTDGGGTLYNLPPGGFRFPFVAAGSYRFQVGPVPGYTLPSTVPNSGLANDGAGNPYTAVPGSRGEVFVVAVGPALNIDIPADPASSPFFLQKNVSRTEAAAGDFLQYRLELRNNSTVVASATQINDWLPPGMRFQSGSLRVNDQPAADPVAGSDGRTLNFAIGTLAVGATVRLSYVVALGAGVLSGDAINTARASANAGTLNSNPAQVAVRIRDPFFSGRFTIIGRVFEGECNTPWHQLKGVANARILMEDGTYVLTDKDGQYHFEAVRSGTHVVQLDVDSLPEGMQPQPCMENTRFAGRAYSQFVDVKGGGLWRADFYVRNRRSEVGIRLQSGQEGAATTQVTGKSSVRSHRVEVDGSGAVENLRIMAMLPDDVVYEPGSTRVDGAAAPDPAIADALATFSLGVEKRPVWKRVIEFRTRQKGKPVASTEALPPVVPPLSEVMPQSDAPISVPASAPVVAPVVMPVPSPAQSSRPSAQPEPELVTAPLEAPEPIATPNPLPPPALAVPSEPAVPPRLLFVPASAAPPAPGISTESLNPFASPAGPRPTAPLLPVIGAKLIYSARFDRCSALLRLDDQNALETLVADLRKMGDVVRVELTGFADSRELSPECRRRFKDNVALSQARAKALGEFVAPRLGMSPREIVVVGRGIDAPVADNRTPEGMAKNRSADLIFYTRAYESAAAPVIVSATQDSPASPAAAAVTSTAATVPPPATAAETFLAPDPVASEMLPAALQTDGVLSTADMPVPEKDLVVTRGNATANESETMARDAGEENTQQNASDNGPAPTPENSSAPILFPAQSAASENPTVAGTGNPAAIPPVGVPGIVPDTVPSTATQVAEAIAGENLPALSVEVVPIPAPDAASAVESLPSGTPADSAIVPQSVPVNTGEGQAGASVSTGDCAAAPGVLKVIASFERAGKRAMTPAAENQLPCAAETSSGVPAERTQDSSRKVIDITPVSVVTTVVPELQVLQKKRLAISSDPVASGADRDWFTGRQPGVNWLFPGPEHNPRSPAVRIVIQHLPGQTVLLTQPDGNPVDALNFDGTLISADRKMAVSIWRGVLLGEGANMFRAEVLDAAGKPVQTLSRSLHYSNTPARAELVPEQSILVADGKTPPVLAVRILDRDGRPVRAGVTGPMQIQAPYRTQREVEFEQTRQLAGIDRFTPQYRVEGDEGIAYIELAPTTESGNALLELSFAHADNTTRRQEIRAWLETRARDWVVVGFAEGTVGYNTLKDNSQALEGRVEDGTYTDGQISLYAKGRVLGKWLLTMVFDSDKANDSRKSLLGTIDPNEYYTLYGDGGQQRYDAPSQDKLYLKIERGQFYALFGDYDTGLTQTQLSRYNRTLNGLKSENGGGPVVFTVFAAETPQNFARDEIQGDGTSGLYQLSQRGIVLNSEKIRIETRDRLHSERIIESRTLTRHIDYDIDFSNGTLFFRQPVNIRDFDFNPIFIVAEYESLGVADKELNAGGRVGVSLREGRVQVGVSAIHEQSNLGSSNLGGADLKWKVGKDSELRVEAARTSGQDATVSRDGVAWLTEFEHHSGAYDALLYAWHQEPGFGLKQQNLSTAGQQKVGGNARLRLDKNWSVQGEVYRQENLVNSATRDALQGKARYETTEGGFSVGAQTISDRADSGPLAGQDYRSDQATLSANRWLLNRKLEISAQSETALGGNHDSADFPDRYVLGASYAITDHARLLVGEEFTDGAFDTHTTRVGLQVQPWKGARLDSTLNQSQISENGARTFGQMGLTQAVLINDRWGLDFSLDSTQTLQRSGQPAPVLNAAHPVTGGPGTAGSSEDFVAVSAGATYRRELWSWNGRAESRNGETTDRYGLVTHFLRQAQAGVAFASSAQLFRTEQAGGTRSWLASLDMSWAWRPLGLHWSMLDRLEFRYEDVENGNVAPGAGAFGFNSLSARDASTRRVINNFALNFVSREWKQSDREGNLFQRYERSQFSLYYGAKYAFDTFDGVGYSGYTDLIGLELRHDLKSWMDIGVQASALNSWSTGSHAYSFGPSIGFSPVTNGWITVGYNYRGFTDRDFDAARYTAQGIYLQMRFKFDQNTRVGGRSLNDARSDEAAQP
ncbi:MAG: OmpA family protein [Burkholderiales bacterium]